MNVPKEAIWQELRGECLDAIPALSHIDQKRPVTLSSWQRLGYYNVVGTAAKRFDIVASSVDFGSALLTDVECFLDSAAEHQVSLWKHVNSSEWISPAWLGVTVYYWSFYISLAITRLTGRTTWFLTRDAVRDFKRLAPTTNPAPGAGCFKLSCGGAASLTDRNLLLEKSDLRLHDETWRILFTSCSSRFARLASGSSTSVEERLFAAIVRSAKLLGPDWPSAFRNAINYSPGFAYGAVRRAIVLKTFGFLKQPATYDFVGILDRFESSLLAARSELAIRANPQVVLELLVYFTFLIHALATELHFELIDRNGLDSRWRSARQRFVQRHGLVCTDGTWPI